MTLKQRLQTAKQYSNAAQDISVKSLDKFLSGLDDHSKEFFELLKKEIQNLNTTKGGKIDKTNKANKDFLKALPQNVLNNLSKTKYLKSANALLDNFNDIVLNTKNAAQIVNDIKVSESLLTNTQRYRRDLAINQLLQQGLSANFVQPIVEIVNNSINLGGNLQELITELEQVLITNASPNSTTGGLLKRYAEVTARDIMFQMQGAVNQAIANEYELDGYAYVGTEIENTRAQCSRWIDKGFIYIKDLPDEISWAYANGTGMIKGTTPNTFAIERGGYNCRHAAIPMRSSVYFGNENEN